jgi:hypothetical protein
MAKLLAELQAKVKELQRQKTTIITAPVSAVDPGTGTFTVQMINQQDGATVPLAGISAPAAFFPAIGDTVQLQVIGSVPQFQPSTVGSDVITDREIAAGVKVHVWRQPNQPVGVDRRRRLDRHRRRQQGVHLRPGRHDRPAEPVPQPQLRGRRGRHAHGHHRLDQLHQRLTGHSITQSITNTGTGARDKTKVRQGGVGAMPATVNTAMGIPAVFTAVQNDVFASRRWSPSRSPTPTRSPRLLVEWLNAANSVIGSAVVLG